MGKATLAQMIERERDIQTLIAEGRTSTQIKQELAIKYNVNEKTIYNQYLQILGEIKKQVAEGREDLRATLMARNDYIYIEAIKNKNYKTALDATSAQAKLAGLAEKTEVVDKKPEFIKIYERGAETPVQDLTLVKTGNDKK